MHLTDKQCQQLLNDSKSIFENTPRINAIPIPSYEEAMGNLGRVIFPKLSKAIKTAAPKRE